MGLSTVLLPILSSNYTQNTPYFVWYTITIVTAGVLELALILGFSLLFGAVMRVFRQPVLLGYLAVGMVLGVLESMGVFEGALTGAEETFYLLSDLGIMFLLFLVGIEMNPDAVRRLGKASLVLGIVQVGVSAAFGYALAVVCGFERLEAIYLGLAFAFSSTIIVVKLLTEMRELQSLFGRLAIGVLLVQDVLAIIALMVLGGVATGSGGGSSYISIFSGFGAAAIILVVGQRYLPYIFHRLASSRELIFVGALAWMLGVVALMDWLGFSLEVGGFLAGIALSRVAEHHEIAVRVRPLRDFCILLFFVLLGSQLVVTNVFAVWPIALAFLVLVVAWKTLVVMTTMRFMGYRSRTGFLTGLSLAQVSEFSFVLVTLGYRLGHVGDEVMALVTMVGVLSIAISAYAYEEHDRLEHIVRPLLKWFDVVHARNEDKGKRLTARPILLVGFQRTGQSIAMHLPKRDLLVMEYDPEMSAILEREKYSHMFADASDTEVFSEMDLSQVKLAIMTGPSFDDNISFLRRMHEENVRRRSSGEEQLRVVLRAESETDAEACYVAGADYVLLPHFTSGSYLGYLIAGDMTLSSLAKAKTAERAILKKDFYHSPHLIAHERITHTFPPAIKRPRV